MTIKSYHNAKRNASELVQLYTELMNQKTECRMIVQFESEDNYCMVQLANDDGTPLSDGVVCWISNNEDCDLCINCMDDIEALVKIQSLILRDDFREAWIESF